MEDTITFPKFEAIADDYLKKASILTNQESWLERLKKARPNIHEPAVEFLSKIEKIVKIMPEEDENILRKKFKDITNSATEWKPGYHDRFFELLIEILGYGFLKEKHYQPSIITTPDLEATKNNETVIMECKSIGRSEEEREYLSFVRESPSNMRARDVEYGSTLEADNNPYQKKIKSTIKTAKDQLGAYPKEVSKRFMFIHFSIDSALVPIERDAVKLIKLAAKDLKKSGIIPIWFRNYDTSQRID